ncbi:hypothetical protein VC83_00117 [Pseudogymnoascus destructans]|uniref:Uncharacterized protein n=1 Tax=Pseudogymnoascus destructans TaxID=655981 RepID=A0A177AMY7_9PEZI|nr:uncharacterized protein VC83_00117 [Pseudogymnoascus destructans]OAF63395.1 hypothetical protein VC83_00117 [Pseudogymnoascus destructans]
MNLLHPGAGLDGHEYSKNAPKSRSPSPQITLHRTKLETPSKPARRTTTGQLSPTKLRDIPDRVADDAMSDDGRSCAYSEGSAVARGRSKRKCRHRSTSYYLAHPAPTLTQKQRLLHIRPKLLLQLQQLSADARPRPMVDVISSSTFVPRLSKKFPNLYRGSGELGINDVMIVRSDDYDALDEEKEVESVVEDAARDRDVLAVICQVPKGDLGTVEICLEDGSRWTAGPSSKGVLELIKTDPLTGERTIGRWVPRGTSRRNSLQTPARGTGPAGAEPTYQFSFIDPSTRRHPILATLTQGTLKISDTYSPVANSEEEHPPVSSRTSLDGEQGDGDSNMNVDRKVLTVYEEQRLLIEVSAVWVALKQGWCPSFRYGDCCSPTSSAKFATPPSSSTASFKGERPRSFSLTPSGAARHRRSRSNTVTSIPESVDSSTGTTRSRRGVFARATFSASTFSAALVESEAGAGNKRNSAPPSAFQQLQFKLPERSFSNGAAFMQKAAKRRAGRPASSSGSEGVGTPRRGSLDGIGPGLGLPSLGFRESLVKDRRRPLSEVVGGKIGRRGGESEGKKTPPPPPVAKKDKEKENRRFSSIIKFFRRGRGGGVERRRDDTQL